MSTLYEYYASKRMRPTFANFRDEHELARYCELRGNVFLRLMLPRSTFDRKQVLEFGPDTGENSLVFAHWGALLTLVEPNLDAHNFIRAYFSKFNSGENLVGIFDNSLLDFVPNTKYDIVDAEGFVCTIQPSNLWISKIDECLTQDGFLIINYPELYGGFFDLLLKAIYHFVIHSTPRITGLDAATQLFLPKWESIQHTRQLGSWFMDVIENPFNRMKWFIDSVSLLEEMHANGFRLYSSWPNYKDSLAIQWIKSPYLEKQELHSSTEFIKQSRLSHLLGEKCFLATPREEAVNNARLLIEITDGLVDKPSMSACAEATKCVANMSTALRSNKSIGIGGNVGNSLGILSMVGTIFKIMSRGNTDELVEFCRNDKTFITTWGMPNHYAVFQRCKSSESSRQF